MLCNMPTYVLVPESFVHNPKLLSLLCYFGPTHCFWLEALNSQIEKGRGPKIFARSARELQHLPPLNPGYATELGNYDSYEVFSSFSIYFLFA